MPTLFIESAGLPTLEPDSPSLSLAKALAPNPNPQWTEYEMRSIDEWIARQGVKLDRPEAIRRLVEIGLRQKKESDDGGGSDSPRALGRNRD
jgi:hypothetical protein